MLEFVVLQHKIIVTETPVKCAGKHDSEGIHGVQFHVNGGSNVKISTSFLRDQCLGEWAFHI